MKRAVSLFLCLLLLVVLSPAALASTFGQVDVFAKYLFVSGLPEFALKNGEGGGTLSDGTEISVTGAPSNATWLVVRQIPQSVSEPYEWFREVLGNKTMQAYEIYFRDDLGNRIPANGAVVTITVPGGMSDVDVYSVDPNNSHAELTSSIKNGKVTFRTDGKRYYVLTGTASSSGGDGNDPPKTGDDSRVLLWLLLLLVAFAGMVLCIALGKRRRKGAERKK